MNTRLRLVVADKDELIAGHGALLYLVLTVWRWPSALTGTVLVVVSHRQARAAVDALAHLVEGSYDMQATNLARALGFEVASGLLSPTVSAEVTHISARTPDG